MAKNNIRLRYSGFVMFLFRLVSIGTGLLFTLMITRTVSPKEYGVYSNLSDVLSYFTLTSTIIPFWVTRFIARGHPSSSRTGFIINLLIAAASSTIYLSTVPKIINALQIHEEYLPIYVISVFLILENHILAVFEAILYSNHPEMLGFGLFVLEVSRVALGFLLIINLEMGLMGAITSLITAFLIQIIFYLKYLLRDFDGEVKWSYVKEWFKASIINIYGIISGRILAFTNILLFIFGGELSRAYYGTSLAIASIISYSSSLAFALYPKLLSGAGSKDVSLSIKMALMFAIPMTFGAITISEELLIILNPSYSIAKPILIVLSLNNLLSVSSSIFDSIIGGTEKLDANAKISYRGLVKSKLFLRLTLQYVEAAMDVPFIYVIFSSVSLDPLTAALYLASINTAAGALLTLAKYLIARKCIKIEVPWISIAKYFGASLAMTLFLYALQTPARLTLTVSKTLIGALIYFLILSIVDEEAREIMKLAKGEVLKIFLGWAGVEGKR